MIEATEICALLKECSVFEDVEASAMLPFCRRALEKVVCSLKEGVDLSHPLVLITAAAVARFDLFVSLLGETERFRSYKAGDITIQKDFQREVEVERALRDEALANGAAILKDGGFCFVCK